MEIVLLHLNIELKENEKDNFNAIQHLCAVRLSAGTREYAEKTEESHLWADDREDGQRAAAWREAEEESSQAQ